MIIQDEQEIIGLLKDIQFEKGSAPQKVQFLVGNGQWVTRPVSFDGCKVKVDQEYYDPEQLIGVEIKVH